MKRTTLAVATVAAGLATVALGGTKPPPSTGGSPPPCIGDSTGDLKVDFEDMVRVLADWGPCGLATKDLGVNNKPQYLPCPSDINGDGQVNFKDLSEVLSRYGTSCS